MKIRKTNKNLSLPKYQTSGSVGLDLYVSGNHTIPSKTMGIIPFGINIKPHLSVFETEVPFTILVPRSSLFKKTGLMLANSIGIIDADYSGNDDEIMGCLYNTTDKPVSLKEGDRICQLVQIVALKSEIEQVDDMDEINRGGFGSTDEYK